MEMRKLADVPPEEIREWLRKLEEAGISLWTLLYAHVALSAVEDAKATIAEYPEIGGDWAWYDELQASAEGEMDDSNDGIRSFYDSALELGRHLGLPMEGR